MSPALPVSTEGRSTACTWSTDHMINLMHGKPVRQRRLRAQPAFSSQGHKYNHRIMHTLPVMSAEGITQSQCGALTSLISG